MSYECLEEDELITMKLALQCMIDNVMVSSLIEKASFEMNKIDDELRKR